MTKKQKYYACFVPATRKKLVTAVWAECEAAVKGVKGARYKAFDTEKEAKNWLKTGAKYGPPKSTVKSKLSKVLAPGIYFDAGTGRGDGVEISVTDEKGKNLLDKVLLPEELNKYGKHLLENREATNNFGELLACRHALMIAIDSGIKKVFGDSRLVVEYWSRGFIKKKDIAPETVKLAEEVTKIRSEFEKSGGSVHRVSGDINPADLGFHK